ncbi:LysR family transcriptional regulator [Thalassospira profundimaris]|uniref:LysR family transcriptional regulator n=1 Tax=Thalassospira profundimaris TaxID=502049 RepID=UPI0015F0785F|nr:LysR family transcriptional regulator [Thalassospira profundimaris]
MPRSPQLDDRRITLEQLRAFVAVAGELDFQRASSQLRRSQSALTQSLQKLEDILECRLIARRRGQVEDLTENGKRLLPLAEEILSRLSAAVESFRQPALRGRIRLGVPDDFPLGNIAGAVRRCMEANPALRVEVTSALSSALQDLYRNQNIDMIIYKRIGDDNTGTPRPGGINEWQNNRDTSLLHRQPLHWACAAAFASPIKGEIPLITFPDGCAYRAAAIRALKQQGLGYFNAYRSASYQNIRAAISNGLGIGILPQSALNDDHISLNGQTMLPALPDIELVMAYQRQNTLLCQFRQQLLRNIDFAALKTE